MGDDEDDIEDDGEAVNEDEDEYDDLYIGSSPSPRRYILFVHLLPNVRSCL